MVWKGVIVEESMIDASLFDMVTEVGYSENLIEDEGEKGAMHSHEFELQDEKKDSFVAAAKKLVKQGWYLHLCQNGTMIVIFNDRCFEFNENEDDKIRAAERHGVSIGIPPEHVNFTEMIRNPFY